MGGANLNCRKWSELGQTDGKSKRKAYWQIMMGVKTAGT